MKFDVFISHSYEDKIVFVKPLADKLVEFGLNVWYDEFTLKVGDSLSKSIDKGLSNSEYGIVVFSKSFFKKRWSDYELRGLISKEIESQKVILPIWHEITKKEIIKFSPTLADKFALDSKALTIPQIGLKILEVVKPKVYENLLRYILFKQKITQGKINKYALKDLKMGPIRHKKLPPNFIVRLRMVHKIFEEVYNFSFEETLDHFKRDLHPYDELAIWEKMAFTYLEFIYNKSFDVSAKREIFRAIFLLSIGSLSIIELKKFKHLDNSDLKNIIKTYTNLNKER